MPEFLTGNTVEAPYAGAVDISDPRGWAESYQSALTTQLMVDNPVTPHLPWFESNTANFVKTKLQEHYEAGNISEEDWVFYTGRRIGGVSPRWEDLAEYTNKELGLQDIPTAEDYEKQRQQEYQDVVAREDRVRENQSFLGKLGSLAGTANAAMIDPLYALGMLTGVGSATTALQVGLRTAAIEASLELAAQPMKYQWKTGLGLEHGAAQAFVDVVSAGVGGGVLAGGGKALSGVTVRAARNLLDKFPDRKVLDPVRVLLNQSDPEDDLASVMLKDEAVDKAVNNRRIPKDVGGADAEIPEFEQAVKATMEKYGISDEAPETKTPAVSKTKWERTERMKKRQAKKRGEKYEMRPYPEQQEKSKVVGTEHEQAYSGEKDTASLLGADSKTPDGEWMNESLKNVTEASERIRLLEECF